MADEERGKELPQRVRGATRAAPATSVTSPSALSDELRQRMQASQDTRVACDRVTCAALTARGFPAHELLVVGPASGDPFRSAAVAVETPAVLSMLGSSLATGWTPDVLASFGSGPAHTAIRVVGPARRGSVPDLAEPRPGCQEDRRGGAAERLTDQRPGAGRPAARRRPGRLAGCCSRWPTWPGSSRSASYSSATTVPGRAPTSRCASSTWPRSVPAAHQVPAAYVKSVQAYLGQANSRYRPASMTTVVLANGQAVLRVDFSAPSPFEVFGTQGSP